MDSNDRLIAWITPCGGAEFLAAFVSASARSRTEPATQRCSSPVEARQWVWAQAEAIGVRVEWLSDDDRPATRPHPHTDRAVRPPKRMAPR